MRDREMPEVKLPEPDINPGEQVTIKYMSAEDFEAELDKPTGPPPRPRKPR
jgi:hypothetical protein